MAKEKLVKNITSRDEDFAQWYTDVVREANLCDYSSVKGCMNYLPNGYAIWELIQADLDRRTGSCMGNTRWNGKTAGKIMRTPYIRDIVL